MFTFKDIQRLRLGGTMDSLALASLSAGLFATHPVAASTLAESAIPAGFILSALGGGWLARRALHPLSDAGLFKSELRIRSSDLPYQATNLNSVEGMLLGYCSDSGKPLVLPYEDLMRHWVIVGQSGVGKTVLGRLLMFQQIAKGGGLIFIDG
jgi:hypothetical protein